MDREVRYLPAARRDMLDILDYIQRDSPGAAERFVGLIDDRISLLGRFPEMGREIKDERLRRLGYRILVIEDYVAFYVIKESAVEIRRVMHGGRRYEFLV